ncbi:helix-turn-helix domain-containing protein [Apilactobacillus xinyiensis]|uniref:helix-turn-helix domain-containing protein n=1 Tax=Apilactobacillus xinyiensis TaxID=2841032 RepID=UPI00200CED1F|nr:helix-turn-helix transcriptional regulator [Apilactobacillus xinyiensis]MCL0330072.1 helix-turn-helix domain-containing protein [Apilactobacillus xinyiensis]
MNLGEKIRKLRIKNNITQYDLAKKINASRTAISGWETNRSIPDLFTIIEISKFFNVTPDYLIRNDKILLKKISLSKRKKQIIVLLTIFIITTLSIMIWFSILCYNANLTSVSPNSIKIIKVKKIPVFFKEDKIKNVKKHQDYKYDIYFKYNGNFSFIENPPIVATYKDPYGNLFINIEARNSLNVFKNLQLHKKTYKITTNAYPYSSNRGKNIIMYDQDEMKNTKMSKLKSNKIIISANENK